MIRYFARHPTAGNLLMVLASVLGVLMVLDLRRESMPRLLPDEVEVRVLYPGASALDVEEGICRPLEEALGGVPFLDEMRSEAREGRGTVTCVMLEGADFDRFQGRIESEVSALSSLPTDAEDPTVEALGLEDKVLAIHVAAASSPLRLKGYCEELKDRLRRLDGVSLVEVQGFGEHQIRVELDPEALRRFAIGPADVAQALHAQSVDLPVGALETGERDLLLRFVERRRTPAELGDLVVRAAPGGAALRVRDLARVSEVFDDPWDRIEHEGVHAGRIVVKKTAAEDSLTIADTVRAFVEAERGRVPEGVSLHVTEDSSDVLRGQIALVVTNGWQGMVLVAVSLWLFFSLRLAGWVVMGVPVSVLGACLFMPGLGLSVNMLTLIGFLLALGLLMDDAIVIAENVATHKRMGKSAVRAAIDGTSEVKAGVIASFITTVCVLGPLTMIGGESGQRLRVIPLVLILVMAVSLIEAFFILPGHLGHALGHGEGKEPGAFRRGFDHVLSFLRERVVGGLVDVALGHRYLTLSLALGALLGCFGLMAGGRIPTRPMPDLQGDVIAARVLMPQGTRLDATRSVVDEVLAGLAATDEEWSARQPAGERLVLTWSVRYGENADAYETGAHVATVSADLLTAEARTGSTDAYLTTWRERCGPLPGAVAVLFTTPSGGAGGKPIELRFSGDDLEELDRVTRRAVDFLARFDGAKNLLADLRPGKPEMRLELEPTAASLGLTADTIARHVSAAFQGASVDELQVGPERIDVQTRFGAAARASRADLGDMAVPVPGGGQVPLASVARLEGGRGWGRIARVDGERTVTVRGEVDNARGNASQILAAFQREFEPELAREHPGVRVSLAGESRDAARTQSSMSVAMLLGLLGVYVLLSFQFKSYAEPLVVMAAIPMALIGVILGHWLLDFPFTLPSTLGFISLAGIVVNDSILLVEFIKAARERGEDVRTAAAQASRSRFRAVLLTSSTTIAGLLPLLAETSLQAQLLKGLVISVSFGMMAATVLVLVIVPCLYAILGDLGLLARTEAA